MLISDATNLTRLMNCNGSRLMPPDPKLGERDDTVRNEGNAAHWLASEVFNGRFAAIELIDRRAPNGIYITSDMADHVSEYLDTLRRSPDQTSAIEVETSFAGANWQINARADHVGFNARDNWLLIDDFKYGFSLVEPEMNWPMIAHAIGTCIRHGLTPEKIVLTVHQPRAKHHLGTVRSWEIDYPQLLALYNQINETLTNPTDQLRTGPHCYKCPAFLSCPARQAAELNAIEVAQTAFSAEVMPDELVFRLSQIARALELLKQSEKAYIELGAHKVKQGVVLDGYSVEMEWSNRSWNDGVTPEFMQILTGKDLTKPQLMTPAQAEKIVDASIIAPFVSRKPKGAKLVKMSAAKKAAKLFGKK